MADATDDDEWRFLVDENLQPGLADALTEAGFTAEYLLDASGLFEGADDIEHVLPYCRRTGAVLVTNDFHDFNPTRLSADDHAGVIIVYEKDRAPSEIAAEIERITEAYDRREQFTGFENADDWGSSRG